MAHLYSTFGKSGAWGAKGWPPLLQTNLDFVTSLTWKGMTRAM